MQGLSLRVIAAMVAAPPFVEPFRKIDPVLLEVWLESKREGCAKLLSFTSNTLTPFC